MSLQGQSLHYYRLIQAHERLLGVNNKIDCVLKTGRCHASSLQVITFFLFHHHLILSLFAPAHTEGQRIKKY